MILRLSYLLFFILHTVYTQFNMTVFTPLPTVTFTEGLIFASIRKNATEVYASVRQSSTSKIIKWNTTSPTNVYRQGEYILPFYTTYTFSYVFFFKGYILACANNYPPRLFNESTFEYIGTLSINLVFGRGEYIQSKNVFFFGSNTGHVGYFTVDNNILTNPAIYLHNDSITNFVFLQKSTFQNYVTVSFKFTNNILIYRTSDWQLIKNFTVFSVGVYTQAWSPDQRYLMVFMFSQIFVYIYDRDLNFSMVKNQTIGFKNIRTNFYYEETYTVVAMAQFTQQVITINWYDYSTQIIYPINGWKMYRSETGQSMTIFQQSVNTAWYFGINPYCTGNTIYSIPDKKCVQCDPNCAKCNTLTICSLCAANYTLVNGSCQACGTSTFYNSYTMLCDSCATNCDSCSSSSVCLVCANGAVKVNNSCILCLIGSTFNLTTLSCQITCATNCTTCASSNTCSVCSSNYNLMLNGQCQICSSGTFYNSITKNCESCSLSCLICTSASICTSCFPLSFLVNGTCITCPNFNTFNYTSSSCQPNCTSNCISCMNSTYCSSCQTNYDLQGGDCVLQNSTNQNKNQNTNQNKNQNTNQNTNQNDYQSRSRSNTLYDITMGVTVQNDLIGQLNKVPGSRRIMRQLFAFFLNIDHLWLYIYHKREYGYYVDRLLKAVQNLQQQKWNLVSDQILNKTLNLDINTISDPLNYKINQTSWKYVQVQSQSSSFLQNSLDYFFLNVPLVIGMFLIFKLLFYLTFKFQVSLLFRQYAFNGYLVLMLVQGNCQSFSYLFMYDSKQTTQLNFDQKVMNILTIVLFMIFMAQLIAGFFIIKSNYDQHAKYFYDNCSNTLSGSTHLLIEYGLLNFLLGSMHVMLQDDYNVQLLILLLIEITFILLIVGSINKSKIYEYKYIQWQSILASFLRICLIVSYYFDQSIPGKYNVTQEPQMYLIIIYLFNWIISTLISYFLTIRNLVQFIIKKLITSKPISKIHQNPYLIRYQNLARRQIKKQNIKIQTIDVEVDGDTNNRLKLQVVLGDNLNGTVSITHKIKLYKKQKNRQQKLNKDKNKNNEQNKNYNRVNKYSKTKQVQKKYEYKENNKKQSTKIYGNNQYRRNHLQSQQSEQKYKNNMFKRKLNHNMSKLENNKLDHINKQAQNRYSNQYSQGYQKDKLKGEQQNNKFKKPKFIGFNLKKDKIFSSSFSQMKNHPNSQIQSILQKQQNQQRKYATNRTHVVGKRTHIIGNGHNPIINPIKNNITDKNNKEKQTQQPIRKQTKQKEGIRIKKNRNLQSMQVEINNGIFW